MTVSRAKLVSEKTEEKDTHSFSVSSISRNMKHGKLQLLQLIQFGKRNKPLAAVSQLLAVSKEVNFVPNILTNC